MSKVILFIVFGSIAPNITTNTNIFVLGQIVEIVELNTNIPISFVNNLGIGANIEFLYLPDNIQRASIAHELGHVEYHINTNRYLSRSSYYRIFGTADPREVEADLYGADIVGEYIMSEYLEYYINICEDNEIYNCYTEAKLRKRMMDGRYCI